MRAALLVSLALAGCAPDPDDTDPDAAFPELVVDLEGEYGPDVPDAAYVRTVTLMPEVQDGAVAFNDSGVLITSELPFPAMLPFLPRTRDTLSAQLYAAGESGYTVAASSSEHTFQSPLSEIVLWGTVAEPRALNLEVATTPTEGEITARLVHTTPGLPYAGFGPATGAPELSAVEGGVSAWTTLPAGSQIRWYLDINGDGRGDLPYQGWSLPAVDGLGQPQIVDIFVVPSGQTLPSPNPPLPVPFLLIVPLTGPDEAFAVTPAL